MTNGRNSAAESMRSVLEVVHTQKWKGMLKAEHARGGYLEEGAIYVMAGQPIYARAGMLQGHEALKYLLSWQRIYFAFDVEAQRPKANLTATHYLGNTNTQRTAARFPTHIQTSALPPQRIPTTEELRWNAGGTAKSFAYAGTGVLGVEGLVPQKVETKRDALSLPLSRHQRHIYFMVDGRRTVSDLARCVNRPVSEVELILNELREQDLVAI